MNDTSHAKHLVIAGVTRAGTTSLYNYLADHPNVARSTIKETRFFLASDELKRMHRFEEGLDAYENYFPNVSGGRGGFRGDFRGIRLEATPDYFYCPLAAKRIAESLPGSHVVLIFRDPIARLISWRRYAVQNGLLDPAVSLADYIDRQFAVDADDTPPPQHMRALREGRYARYLDPWLEHFNQDQLTVLSYSQLLNEPAALVKQLCNRLGLDPAFYDRYDFKVHNASRPVRLPGIHAAYRSLIWRIKPHVHDKPAARAVLRRVRRVTDAVLGRSAKHDATPASADQLTDADRARLEAYYRDQPEQLCAKLGLTNWRW